MPVLVNLRLLQEHNQHLDGEVPAAELDFASGDEVIATESPLSYDVEAQLMEDDILVTGLLSWPFQCECVRCLKSFEYVAKLREWACLIPLKGEDAAPIMNDYVDLTPYMREDILLGLPSHPLCRPDCQFTPGKHVSGDDGADQKPSGTAWDELDKLDLD